MKRFVSVVTLVLLMLPSVALANRSGSTGQFLTVDGVQYENTGENDGTIHWYTNTPNPQSASFDGVGWLGNGSEHLPCDGLVHWVFAKKAERLVVSHCESSNDTTTTTTMPEETTTTQPEKETTTTTEGTTTTNVEESTSTTNVEEETTTTTNDETTSTENDDSETPTSEEGEVLPFTGVNGYYFLIALGLSLAGLAALGYASRFVKE